MNAGFDLLCPKCGQLEHELDSIYCQNCGLELLNYCSNKQCTNNCDYDEHVPLAQSARYCNICGEKSTHFEYLSEDS